MNKQMWTLGGLVALMALPSTASAQVRPGNIQVDAGAAKGEIVLDGFPTGIEAPGTLESVPPGEHMISIEYGCFLAEGSVLVETEETAQANLTPKNRGGEGTIRLRGLSRGAQVLIDDAPVDSPEEGVSAACGARRLVVDAPGYEAWEELVVVTTGKWVTVEPQLVEEEFIEERPVERPRYDEVDEDLDDLDRELMELDGPDSAEMAERRRLEEEEAQRRREEAERRRREEEERRAREEAERLERFGDIDSLDELDEEEDDRGRGRSRDRDRGEDSGGRDAFDDLDDLDDELDELDDDRGFDDFDELDELSDVDRELMDLDDDRGGYSDLDELDGDRGGRDKPEREKKDLNIPLRPIGLGAGVVVAGTGIGIAAAAQPTVSRTQDLIDTLNANNVSDGLSEALEDNRTAKAQRTAGILVGVAGVGVGAASWFLIPPMDKDADLLVVPMEEGGAYGELTVRF